MEWSSLLPGAIGPLVGAGLLLLLPGISGKLTPLGVSVPEGKASDPAVRGATRLYIVGVGIAALIAVTSGLLLSESRWQVPASMTILAGLCALVFSVSRGQLIRAKHDGNWYTGVKVGLSATLDSRTRTTGPVWFGHLASLAITISSAILGATIYSKLPARIATHWSNLNSPDGFSDTSIASAYVFVIVGLAVAAICATIAWALKYAPVENRFSTDAETALRYGSAQLNAGQIFVATLSFGMALSLATLNSLRWENPDGAFPMGIPLALLAATFLLSGIAAWVRYRHCIAVRAPKATGNKARIDSPDDDTHWAGGLIYINKNDKAIFVPKRFGIGWTINAGTPAGAVILAVLAALIALGFTVTVGNIFK